MIVSFLTYALSPGPPAAKFRGTADAILQTAGWDARKKPRREMFVCSKQPIDHHAPFMRR